MWSDFTSISPKTHLNNYHLVSSVIFKTSFSSSSSLKPLCDMKSNWSLWRSLEEFEDIKGVIRIRKSKDRQHNSQKKKDKQQSTKHTHKTKDWVTRTPLKTGGELKCSGRISSYCSTSGIHRVNLVTNQVISLEGGKDREVFTTNETYP